MKTYNEILKDIEKTNAALKAAQEKENALTDKIYSAPDLLTKRETRETVRDELNKTSEKINDLKITIKMQQNNAKRALYNEIIPVFIATLEKYAGKPYGEKTREKISDEIKTATGCRCFINNSYSDTEINIYTGRYNYDLKFYTKDFKILSSENKIQAPAAENLRLYYVSEYIENIPAAIKAMKKAYKKAVEKQKELETICDEFNNYAVDGINRIYKDKWIPENFRV